jgi:DNA-binding transcriptional regulator YiaG
MNSHAGLIQDALASESCPNCEDQVRETFVTEQIPLDDDDPDSFFEAEVPVLTCTVCGYAFTDHRAEVIRHAAFCAARDMLSPSEIRALRERLGMTRKEMHDAFGIPPASLDRWEHGRLIQNTSMNTLLRALEDADTAARLDRRPKPGAATTESAGAAADNNVIYVNFPALQAQRGSLEEAQRRQAKFGLRDYR